MSPTLLELVITLLLLWAAWQIASWMGPRVIAAFVSYWRPPRRFENRSQNPTEKNITPPDAPGAPPPPHGPVRK